MSLRERLFTMKRLRKKKKSARKLKRDRRVKIMKTRMVLKIPLKKLKENTLRLRTTAVFLAKKPNQTMDSVISLNDVLH